MNSEFERLTRDIGKVNVAGHVVLRGTCPFCNDGVTFRQIGAMSNSLITGPTIAIICEGCKSVMSFSLSKNKFYPAPNLKGLTKLPENIQKYYDEGIRCISADSPNGAATLFRKVIHALGIHYGVAEKNDNKKLYIIINKLHDDGHIVPKLRDALLGIKDIGNDGAHINENEPDIDQVIKLKHLIDTVLNSTVLCDSNLQFVNSVHKKKK